MAPASRTVRGDATTGKWWIRARGATGRAGGIGGRACARQDTQIDTQIDDGVENDGLESEGQEIEAAGEEELRTGDQEHKGTY